ncbi:MAG: cysteine hydrolase [Calditrichaeota bacterium]|nr:cysteine hydrolase [Calditrichota bacterium]
MNVDENKSAIVLIEFQNQWTQEGLYHRLIKGQLESRRVLENTATLVHAAREGGMRIVHAPLIIDPKNKKGWLAHLTFGRVFTKDSHKSEITPGLFMENDLVVKGRYAFDAFVGSNLEQLLNDHSIDTLFFCGFITDQCIAKTMKTALQKGFDGYLVSDCTATVNGFLQKKSEKRFRERVVNHQDVLHGIGQMVN